jgi:Uma2 family endonuclease
MMESRAKRQGRFPMSVPLEQEIEYPESDGQPVGETEIHGEVLLETAGALKRHFAGTPDVYTWGNLFFYYEEGNPHAKFAPDIFVIHGVPKHKRRIYKLWEEGKAPSMILEITSRNTRHEDLGAKKNLYERLGVQEYFLFDPLREYLKPPLQGYQLFDGRYQRMLPSQDGSLLSRTTGLRLAIDGERVRMWDVETGQPLLWSWELFEQARAAEEYEQRAQDAEQRAHTAEQRVRTLEEELARLRRGQ